MKPSPRARRQARRALVQALYQWQMAPLDIVALLAQFQEGESLNKADVEFFRELLLGVTRAVTEQGPDDGDGPVGAFDAQFAGFLDRKVGELDKVELAVLRLGTYELKERLDVPYRVVIDEYVQLAKLFGAEASHKYVNGVLDAVAAELRQVEREAHRAPGSG